MRRRSGNAIERNLSITKPCAWCGKQFGKDHRLSGVQWANAKTCSLECRDRRHSAKQLDNRPPIVDLMTNYIVDPVTGCWNWAGPIEGYGYGVFRYKGKMQRAHVVALKLDGRPPAKGQIACHHCDNPRCINPAHLYVGSNADNARDAAERGRLRRGEQNHNAKLTEDQVRLIRSAFGTATGIARQFHVSRPVISKIRRGESWRHVR